jgi:hypothetical protein
MGYDVNGLPTERLVERTRARGGIGRAAFIREVNRGRRGRGQV